MLDLAGKSEPKYLGTQVSTISLKERVFLKMNQFPNIGTKELCRLLDLDYEKYRETMYAYRSEWRKTKSVESKAQKAQTHKARADCYALTSFDRELAKSVGWVESKNNNHPLLWKKNRSYGRIVWYLNGHIIIHVKPPQRMDRVKRLLCFAFFNTGLLYDPKHLNPFLEKVKWHSASDVFETGRKLPYTKITKYKQTHGIEITLGDRSHPTSVEVNWVHPDWLEKLELMQEHNIKTIEDFNKFLKDLSTPKPLSKYNRFVI